MIAVVGAGAMGTALAMLHDRAGLRTTLLGTKLDDASIEALGSGRPHPSLGITLPSSIDCRRHGRWGAVLPNTERVVIGVSSEGLADVVADTASSARPGATWLVGTKGWDAETLQTPSEVVGSLVSRAGHVAVLGGPALAPELIAGAPVALVCASRDIEAARDIAATLEPAGVSMFVTDDVAGVEIASAYKNVTAIAVGMCEGLSERLPEAVFVHRYANARAAVFALGLRDMNRLALAAGGRTETILGLAGAGDLYVTTLGGRNGAFGRLLGAGETPEQALTAIGSTVEGVPNTRAALALGDRFGVELTAARAVDAVLRGTATPKDAIAAALSSAPAI